MKTKHKLDIVLNGTDTNPYLKLGWGMRYNPFPQIAKYERQAAVLKLQSLGGDPIPDVAYIRNTLFGYFTDEFIEYCCDRFVKGEMVKFSIEWEEGT